MPDEKTFTSLGEVARQMAINVLRAEQSATKGQLELAWFYSGVLFITNSVNLSLLHPEEKQENRYYQDTAIAASRCPKEIARRLLEQGIHIDEVVKNMTPEQMKSDLDRFNAEIHHIFKRNKERVE